VLGGDFELSGVPRMHERPIGDLVDALRSSAARSTTSATKATRRCASTRSPRQLTLDAPIRVRGDVSSQFLTALLMALPLVASVTSSSTSSAS
jgi:3-phosphoshikimate 1-carboxyvinyltransferase